jgi:hypothetical protein
MADHSVRNAGCAGDGTNSGSVVTLLGEVRESRVPDPNTGIASILGVADVAESVPMRQITRGRGWIHDLVTHI